MKYPLLNRIAVALGVLATLFALDAVSFDTEVDRKITHAQQLSSQTDDAILHNLRLLAQRQIVDSLAAQIRLEEFLQRWYGVQLETETEPSRLYDLQRQQASNQQRLTRLYDRYNDASETLERLQSSVPASRYDLLP